MLHIKLQLGCLIILSYVAFIYLKEYQKNHGKLKDTFFDELLILGITSVILDGATAYTVNHLDTVDPVLNKILHVLFLGSLDSVIFALFLYMLHMTGAFPKKKHTKIIIFIPFILNIITLFFCMGSLEYVHGKVTNYSMDPSVYTCFAMAAVYIIMTIVTFFRRLDHIERHKRVGIITYMLVLAVVTGFQMIFPETLISSIGVTIFIVSVYLNSEDPALRELSHFHTETVMSFANLIENRDSSTGGHIKRTSRYVQLIAEELCARGYYRDVLTKDYITNLLKAAPMHDIGKIAVPDAILQKPGRLTDDEYRQMQLHAAKGGDIIRETFRNLGDEDFRRIAFEVARYHHEKWNGCGYPDGLQRKDIPLCARIMSVADVFDAVSEKRCYREAMPLEKCFEIIANGSGQDFDPLIVEIFLDIRHKVEQAHQDFLTQKQGDN